MLIASRDPHQPILFYNIPRGRWFYRKGDPRYWNDAYIPKHAQSENVMKLKVTNYLVLSE
ncbi:hypothetical protein J6590_092176, partial [Homalodisca vitripennis]